MIAAVRVQSRPRGTGWAVATGSGRAAVRYRYVVVLCPVGSGFPRNDWYCRTRASERSFSVTRARSARPERAAAGGKGGRTGETVSRTVPTAGTIRRFVTSADLPPADGPRNPSGARTVTLVRRAALVR